MSSMVDTQEVKPHVEVTSCIRITIAGTREIRIESSSGRVVLLSPGCHAIS